MDIQIGNPESLYLLGFVLGGLALTVWTLALRKHALDKFASQRFRQQLLPRRSLLANLTSTLLVTASLVCLILALMDIRWGKTNREVPQKGIEVMFALDVSRSMLAEDASPNRLKRAKQQIIDMVDEMAGDRVGLVVFAGENRQSVPLTSHYDDFQQVLESVGPHSLRVGGSRLGEAIQAAADGFMDKTNDHKAIVLFTDGEDHESDPVAIAQTLHQEKGIRIFTVGLGDMDQGARIPSGQTNSRNFLEHQGQQVWSKMNGQILNEIAVESEGAYIPAGTKRVNMADVYHSYVANVEQTEFEMATINAWIPRFQWFAGAALLFLLAEVWLTSRRRRSVQESTRQSVSMQGSVAMGGVDHASTHEKPSRAKVAAAALLLACCTALPVQAQSVDDEVAKQINAATQLLDTDATQAINALSQIPVDVSHRDSLNYNLAVAHYRNGDTKAAKTLFQQTSAADDIQIAADSRHNLGNCHYTEGLALAESDREQAKQQLLNAIDQYRNSLRLNRNNPDARTNIELAKAVLDQLNQQEDQSQQDQSQQDQSQQDQSQQDQSQQDQSQQDQSQQDQSQQDQSQQDQSQQDQSQQDQSQQDQSQQDQSQQDQSQQDQSQQDQSQQDQSQQDQSQQDQSQQDQSQQDQSQQDQSQQDQSQQDQSQQDQSQQQDQSSNQQSREENQQSDSESSSNSDSQQNQGQNSESAEEGSEAEPETRDSSEDDSQNRPESNTSNTPPEMQSGRENRNDSELGDSREDSDEISKEAKDVPAGQLTAANEAASDDEEPQQKVAIASDSEKEGAMSREEALKMLQSVRDRDMLRRLRQEQLERSRRRPVDRDW